jgi:hypothetical protein
MKRLIILIAALLIALNLDPGGGPARVLAAGGGNSAAAMACQQKGYTNLIGTDGTTDTSFANAGLCTSYAALGGMLVWSTAAAPCLNGGWQSLAPAATPTQAFTSEAACVQYVGQGGTPVPVTSLTCTYTPGTTGCVAMSGVQVPYYTDSGLGTMTLSGDFTFLADCDFCWGAGSGSGTYTVNGGTFNGGTSGTYTISGTGYAQFFDNSSNAVPCSSSTNGTVYGNITFTDSATQQTTEGSLDISYYGGRTPYDIGVLDTSNNPYYFTFFPSPSEMTVAC